MINLENIRKELSSVQGIYIESILEKNSYITVCLYFDASVKINGAEFDLNNKVNIEIPKEYPVKLPIVFESGEKVIRNFPHINPDIKGTFCLGTEIDIRRRLKPSYPLVKYIQIIAEFLGTYKYYKEYENFPHGDRGHGVAGIVEAYKEIFSVSTKQQVLNLMKIEKLKNEDKNKKCPCNSGKKFKMCHWNLLNTMLQNSMERSQLKRDYRKICGG